MAAGLKQLELLKELNPYQELDEKGKILEDGFRSIAQETGVPVQINRVGSMITVFFTDKPVKDFATAKTSDTQKFAKFFRCMLEKGVYLPASQFEAFFLSTAHSKEDLYQTLEKARECFKNL
jgi:glutamate-1-semialdehyde 2,1-aminomutase